VKKYKVNIIFDGVVLIGPGEPPEDVAYLPGPLFAVMPRANRQVSRYSKLYGDKPIYIPFHLPVVLTELTPLNSDFRRPDEIFKYPPDPPPNPDQRTFSIWYPMRERLVFRIDDEVDDGELTYEVGQQTPCDIDPDNPPLGYDGSIRAVADMREIWPGRSRIRREYLSAQAPVANEVAAQVFVPRGHVSSGDYGRPESAGEVAYFEPKRTNDLVQKCLVPQTRVTVDVDKRVRIFSYSLDTGEKLDSIAFDVTDDADILVGSADPGDIRKLLNQLVDPQPFVKEHTDYDFELYYPLLDGDDDGGGLPVPFSKDGRFGDPNCYTNTVGGST
jgi:hypothetical protein